MGYEKSYGRAGGGSSNGLYIPNHKQSKWKQSLEAAFATCFPKARGEVKTEITGTNHERINFKMTIKSGWWAGGKEKLLAKFSIAEFPGCCGICNGVNFKIDSEYQGGGFGKAVQVIVEDVMVALGYSTAMTTTRKKNIPIIKILNRNQWTAVGTFVNSKTENEIIIWRKDLIFKEENLLAE